MSADAATKAPKAKKSEGFVVKIDKIAKRWLEINKLFPENTADSTVIAAKEALLGLITLYYQTHSSWRAVRDKMCVGFYKETKGARNEGNTSVAMGFAVQYFKTHPESKSVGFINNGTGGAKFQPYYRDEEGIIMVGKEYKPADHVASPNALDVCGFKPKVARDKALVRAELIEQVNLFVKNTGINDIYSFVTGTIREKWEDGLAGLDAEMVALYSLTDAEGKQVLTVPIHPITDLSDPETKQPSYFISQSGEGDHELIATGTLYEQLGARKKAPEGAAAIMSIGIGRGSCQWVAKHPSKNEQCGYNHRAGMNDPAALQTCAVDFGAHLVRGDIAKIAEYASAVKCPVAALKSGCLIWLETDAGEPLRDFLESLAEKV